MKYLLMCLLMFDAVFEAGLDRMFYLRILALER
jgi:hypothetical protein